MRRKRAFVNSPFLANSSNPFEPPPGQGRKSGQLLKRMATRFDKDGDGVLGPKEREAALQAFGR
ncbi:MAG: hypothetical protein OSB19_02520 [Opitutaceae bacterium]|nr:hypothetical protein [Opitutaceae bacterium]